MDTATPPQTERQALQALAKAVQKHARMRNKVSDQRARELAAMIELTYFRGVTDAEVARRCGLNSPETVAKRTRPYAKEKGLTRRRGMRPDAGQAKAMSALVPRPFRRLSDDALWAKLLELRQSIADPAKYHAETVVPLFSRMVVDHGMPVMKIQQQLGTGRNDALYNDLRVYWARQGITPPDGWRA